MKGLWNSFTNWVSGTANDVKDWAVDTYNDVKETAKNTASWIGNNIVKPTGKLISYAERQTKERFQTAINTIIDNVGAELRVEEEIRSLKYYYFATIEKGRGNSKSYGNEKPVTFFGTVGENWWEFWEWSGGVDVNIDDCGVGFSVGGGCFLTFNINNISHEFSINTLGRISHKVAYSIGDEYKYTKYSLNGPETAVAVIGLAAIAYYGGLALLPGLEGLASAIIGGNLIKT